MKGPFVSEIAWNTYAINDYGMSTMYLLAGADRAMLIDTGVGLTDLGKAVRSLTDKPFFVVLTHAHGDHIGGACQVGELYLHPDDDAMFAEYEPKWMDAYIRRMADGGCAQAYEIPQVILTERAPKVLPLKDGEVFDLGGRKVKTLFTPGHTPGSCVLIDEASRILFSGDACNCNLGVQTSVATTLNSLRIIEAHRGEFDRNFTGHTGYGGAPDCLSVSDGILDDCIWICEHILLGDAPAQSAQGSVFGSSMSSVAHGEAKVTFDPARLR